MFALASVTSRHCLRLPCQSFANHRPTTTTTFKKSRQIIIIVSAFSTTLTERIGARFTSRFWKRVATTIKYTRIPFLIASVYSLGFQQGIMECTRNPEMLQKTILQSILASLGVTEEHITIVHDGGILWNSNARHHQVAAVGHAIVRAASNYVKEQLQIAINECKAKLPPDITEADLIEALQYDEKVDEWHKARLRLEGERADKLWQYIFIETASPNAFVTEILPQRFFITSSMLQIAETSDELAVVLGHEVSHLLLGHVSESNAIETVLRTLEVLLLSIDPTAGAFSVAVMAGLASIRHAMTTAYSREHEYEADKIGLEIAARACFDTNKGIAVIRKMHEFHVAAQPTVRNTRVSRVYDTHPPTLDRFDRLTEQAMVENYKKYKQCANKRRLNRRLSCRNEQQNVDALNYWRYFWRPSI